MNAFEIVVVAVNLGAMAVAATQLFTRKRARSAGENGLLWFDHSEDYEVAERPSEDAKDAPIPWRPLRGRN
jgi:hypothetical protein